MRSNLVGSTKVMNFIAPTDGAIDPTNGFEFKTGIYLDRRNWFAALFIVSAVVAQGKKANITLQVLHSNDQNDFTQPGRTPEVLQTATIANGFGQAEIKLDGAHRYVSVKIVADTDEDAAVDSTVSVVGVFGDPVQDY